MRFRLATLRGGRRRRSATCCWDCWRKEEQRIADGWVSAQELTGSRGKAALPAGVTPTRVAAWTVVARVMLNLDETITKE